MPGRPGREPLADALKYAQIGSMITAPMLACGGLGYWLDVKWGTKPWLVLAGLLVGMAAGFVNFFHLVLPKGNGRDRDGG